MITRLTNGNGRFGPDPLRWATRRKIAGTRPRGAPRVFVAFALVLGWLTLQGCATPAGIRQALPPPSHAALMKSILEPALVSGDFQPLFDRFADEVVLHTTTLGGVPASRVFRGKRQVMAHFLNEGNFAGILMENQAEYLGSGERVVVLGSARSPGARTSHGRRHAALVDFREGRITRLLVVEDVSEIAAGVRRESRSSHGKG
jgi:hypothetical protein